MIKRFNRQQIVIGILQFTAGMVLLLIPWLLMFWTASFLIGYVLWNSFLTEHQFASLGTAIFVFFGIRKWSRGGEGFPIFKDSAFHACLNLDPDAAFMREGDNDRVTDLSDLLSQILCSGPRFMCTAIARIHARLPEDSDLEERMGYAIERMQEEGEWEEASKYKDYAQEVGALIRCGLVDFSITRQQLKAVSKQ
jgi:hypothetical protein